MAPGKLLITVLVPYSTLTGADDEPCEITGYGPIPAHLARDIASDAVWKRLVTDPLSGAVLDHGRTAYGPRSRWPTSSGLGMWSAGTRVVAGRRRPASRIM